MLFSVQINNNEMHKSAADFKSVQGNYRIKGG
jgi:hypothetical protein